MLVALLVAPAAAFECHAVKALYHDADCCGEDPSKPVAAECAPLDVVDDLPFFLSDRKETSSDYAGPADVADVFSDADGILVTASATNEYGMPNLLGPLAAPHPSEELSLDLISVQSYEGWFTNKNAYRTTFHSDGAVTSYIMAPQKTADANVNLGSLGRVAWKAGGSLTEEGIDECAHSLCASSSTGVLVVEMAYERYSVLNEGTSMTSKSPTVLVVEFADGVATKAVQRYAFDVGSYDTRVVVLGTKRRKELDGASRLIEALARKTQKVRNEVYTPFLPVADDASLLAGRNVVFVNNLGYEWPLYGAYASALSKLGAHATEFECGVHFAENDVTDLSVSKCVDALLAHVDATFGATSKVTLLSHSWSGVPITYATAMLGSRAERVVYYGAAIPDVTNGQGYGPQINYNLQVPWTERGVSSYQYEHLMLGLAPEVANKRIGDFPGWMFEGEPSLPDADMSAFSGKTSILLGVQDWSAGVTESGGNNYLAQAARAGIRTVRVLHVPGDHFHLLNDPSLFASYVYYAIRVPPPTPPSSS
jgi:hypothetical protein